MMAQTPEHPDTDELVAFGMGRLAPEQASTIEAHLDDCPTCCETLLDLKDDTFVALVRSAPQSNEVGAGDAVVSPGSTDSRTDGRDGDHESFDETVMLRAEQREARKGLPQELAEHPRYHIAGLIGRGGMGDVYQAEHRLMNRTVALKVINRELTRNSQAVQRFHREVQSAARLTHPNIVTAYDAEQAGDAHYLVMEYVDGTDLAKLVKEQGPLAVNNACEYVRQAAAGLQHAHEQGMVHRDIKPHNLMVTPAGQIKILDFGLATLVRDAGCELRDASDDFPTSRIPDPEARDLTTAGTMMGTPDFISPEQAGDARSVDIRSDIYSLGCTLYYLLTGKPPFDEGSAADRVAAHLDREPVAIQNLRSDIPDELAEVIRRMMAKDPADRFQSPTEVADALAPFVDQHRSGDGDVGHHFRGMGPSAQRPSLVGLYVIGSLSIVIFALSFGVLNPLFAGTAEWIQWWWRIGSKASLPVGALILILADRSERTNSHSAALKAGWLSLLPLNPVSILLLPVTLWTIAVLRRPETQRAYERGDLPVVDADEGRRRWPMIIAMVGSILIALAGTIIYVTTDRGTLVIESVDDSVEIVLSQVNVDATDEESEQAQLTFIDVVSGSTVKVLRSGTYVARIRGNETGLELDQDRFVLRRGDEVLVRVTRRESRPRGMSPIGERKQSLDRAASAQLEHAFKKLVTDVRQATSDADWRRIIGRNAAVMINLPLDESRGLIRLLANLPDETRQTLLQEGYLRWKADELEESGQAVVSGILSELLNIAPNADPQRQTEEALRARLQQSDTGFMVIDVPESPSPFRRFPRGKQTQESPERAESPQESSGASQAIVWYLIDRPSKVPTMISLCSSGGAVELTRSFFGPATHNQLKTVLEKPYSDDIWQPAATNETSEALAGVIEAASEASTDEDWTALYDQYSPPLKEFSVEVGQRIFQFLSRIPEERREELLREGYLKWKVSDLPQSDREALQQVIRQSSLAWLGDSKVGEQDAEQLAANMNTMVDASDVGFAVVNPKEDLQAVVWYLLMPHSPVPMMLPVCTTGERGGDFPMRPVHEQVLKLKDEPYSLPVDQQAARRSGATSQIRQMLAELVTAAADATSDEQWIDVLKQHGALFEEAEVEGDGLDQFGRAELDRMQAAGRSLIRLLVELPEGVREGLLEDGYLKWKFSDLDPARQTAMQQALADVMSASSKMGFFFPKDPQEYVPGMLTSGNVGFAILNVPDADEQLVVWYLLMPEAPMPLMLPLIGSAGESEQAFTKSIYKQLGELEDRPLSKLPVPLLENAD